MALFYCYNNGALGFGDHEGDWEMVQVHLDGDSGFPDEVVYAEYSYASACESGQFHLPENSNWYSASGPIVYVANGSHASYPEEGEYLTEAPGNLDTAFPSEEAYPVYPEVEDLDSNPSWLAWAGKWGGSGSSPEGPAKHEDQWNEPGQWASEIAGTCLGLKQSPSARAQSAPWRASRSNSPVTIVAASFEGSSVSLKYHAVPLKTESKGPRSCF